MPLDRLDLDARIALCTPSHTVKGAPFRTVCSELEKLATPRPERAQLVARHRKAAWQEFASFPVSEYLSLVYGAAALFEEQAGSWASALSRLGYEVGDAFLKSVVGRLAVIMASGKTPIDVLSYAPALYAPTASYGKRSFERVSASEGIFHVREDFLPGEYHLGAVRAGVSINGHSPRVELRKLALLECDVVVRWDASMDRKAS